MKKLLAKFAAMLLVSAFVFAACDSDVSVSEAEKDTLVVVMGAMPVSLDPAGVNDNPSSRVRKQI
jgi:ABC-type oligopeptide transport system substrate-binding subunit